jgi:hypothetical protein
MSSDDKPLQKPHLNNYYELHKLRFIELITIHLQTGENPENFKLIRIEERPRLAQFMESCIPGDFDIGTCWQYLTCLIEELVETINKSFKNNKFVIIKDVEYTPTVESIKLENDNVESKEIESDNIEFPSNTIPSIKPKLNLVHSIKPKLNLIPSVTPKLNITSSSESKINITPNIKNVPINELPTSQSVKTCSSTSRLIKKNPAIYAEVKNIIPEIQSNIIDETKSNTLSEIESTNIPGVQSIIYPETISKIPPIIPNHNIRISKESRTKKNDFKLPDEYVGNDLTVVNYFRLLDNILSFGTINFTNLINPLIKKVIKYSKSTNLYYLKDEDQWIQSSEDIILNKISEIMCSEIDRYTVSLRKSNSYDDGFIVSKKKYLKALSKSFSAFSDKKLIKKYLEDNKDEFQDPRFLVNFEDEDVYLNFLENNLVITKNSKDKILKKDCYKKFEEIYNLMGNTTDIKYRFDRIMLGLLVENTSCSQSIRNNYTGCQFKY